MGRPRIEGPCTVDGCEEPKSAKGLCKRHYRIQWHAANPPRVDASKKSYHPLFSQWFERKDRGSLCEEWANDFWAFVEAVGERPSPNHVLRPNNRHEPYGPRNWRWVKLLSRQKGESVAAFNARKWDHRQEQHPDFERRRHLIRNFGLTPEQYEAMLSAQGGVCAICKNPETSTHKSTGAVKSLAVDHDEETGRIRDLLCWRCNTTIGKANHDPILLTAMADYCRIWKSESHPGLGRPAPAYAMSQEIMLETEWGTITASDAARRAGLLPKTVHTRIRNGWPLDTVLQPLKKPSRFRKA